MNDGGSARDLQGAVAVVTGGSGDIGAQTARTIAAFLPGMVERRAGAVVTMASAAARLPAQSAAAYAAAKAGVIAFSRHLALEHGPDGIRVNCLAPSAIETKRMREWVPEGARQALARAFPLGRIGLPADVAEAAAFLASPASSWITGTTLDVSGGKVMIGERQENSGRCASMRSPSSAC